MPRELPVSGSAFWQSAAIKAQSKNYPARFQGRVPVRIKMRMTVRPDDLCYLIPGYVKAGTVLCQNEVYEATTNSHGAVSGICANGFVLGVKPDEFDVVDWYEPIKQTKGNT